MRDQLKAAGWLRVQQRRMLGIIPTARLGLYDEEMVGGLADPVTEALCRAIDGLRRPRPGAGCSALGQMPTVLSFKEDSQHRQELRELTFAAIAPIVGLHQAIEIYHEDVRAGSAGAGNG